MNSWAHLVVHVIMRLSKTKHEYETVFSLATLDVAQHMATLDVAKHIAQG